MVLELRYCTDCGEPTYLPPKRFYPSSTVKPRCIDDHTFHWKEAWLEKYERRKKEEAKSPKTD